MNIQDIYTYQIQVNVCIINRRSYISSLIIGGSQWSQTLAPTLAWNGVACSSSGSRLAVIGLDSSYDAGWIYISSSRKSS